MRVRLLAVGGRMPAWVDTGVEDYQRRLPNHIDFGVEVIKLGDRRRGVARAMADESEQLRARLKPADWVIALDEKGRDWNTRDVARQLESWLASGSDVALLVGGPDGLDPELKKAARQRWSLSRLTLPHPLVRVMVAEQIYRAWSLLNNHPYHRE